MYRKLPVPWKIFCLLLNTMGDLIRQCEWLKLVVMARVIEGLQLFQAQLAVQRLLIVIQDTAADIPRRQDTQMEVIMVRADFIVPEA